jgi:DNA-binding CsgD family transcriptional regulator
MLLIEGPAGIGKTRLVEAAIGQARAAGLVIASARSSELERDFPFGVVRQLLEPLVASAAGDEGESMFAGAASLGASVLGDVESDESWSARETYAALHGLYWLTSNIAARNPLAIAVDDAHWADAPSLRFLAFLAKRIDGLPILAVLAKRPSGAGAGRELLEEIASDSTVRVARPAPLTETAVTGLVRAALAQDADEGFCAACHRASGGNPFLLRELILALGATHTEPSARQAARVSEIAPETVARSVLQRLRGLPDAAFSVARSVAILGDGVQPRVAAELAELDEIETAEAADALARADIFSSSGSLEFAHPITRAAVYSSLSEVDRARGHVRAARLLVELDDNLDRAAMHLLPTGPVGEPWALEALRVAAAAATSRGAPDVGATYLKRALSEPLSTDARADLLVDLGAAEVAALPPPAGIEHLTQALALTGDTRRRALISLELGRAHLAALDFAGATGVLERAVLEVGAADRELRERLEAQLLSATVMTLSTAPVANERLARLLDEAQAGRLTDHVLLANVASFTAAFKEPAATGADYARRALADGKLLSDRDPVPIAHAASALMFADRLEEARRVWDSALEAGRRIGSRPLFLFASVSRSHIAWRLGSIPMAEADARAALESTGVQQAQLTGLPFAIMGLVDALIERGELDQAERVFADGGIDGPLPEFLQLNFVLDCRARLRLARGFAREALDDLLECARRLEGWKVRNPGMIPWRSSAALAMNLLGERDEAIRLALEEVELARRFEVPRELGIALRAAGLVEGGDRGVELLREAADVLVTSLAKLEYARALTDLGAAVRRGGQRSKAREPLRRALELAQRCGATALADRARAELVATGARPRRAVFSGLDALTASERRVAEMAAEGSTNREIAQALFVTEKTIEWHLSQSYRKLGIGSRSELRRALDAAIGASDQA